MKWRPVTVFLALFTLVAACGPRPESAETPSANTEEASARQENYVPVEAMRVVQKRVQQSIPLTGQLMPLHAVDIVSEVSGKVQTVRKKLGDWVTDSDTLAVVDDRVPLSNYLQARAQVISAENNVRIAELNLKSDQDLFEAGDISELAYENSKLAKKSAEANYLAARASLSQLEKIWQDTRFTSPIPGQISRKMVDPGVMVNPGMPVYRVVDLSSLKIQVGVPQELVRLVKPGSRARVTVSALNNRAFEGEVKYISPQADEATGGFTVEIHVPNTPRQEILAGMTAKIELILLDPDETLVIPEYALVTKNDSTFVYRIQSGRARLTPLASHKAFGSAVIVDAGLAEGDTIVVVGMKNLGLDTPVFVEKVNGFEF